MSAKGLRQTGTGHAQGSAGASVAGIQGAVGRNLGSEAGGGPGNLTSMWMALTAVPSEGIVGRQVGLSQYLFFDSTLEGVGRGLGQVQSHTDSGSGGDSDLARGDYRRSANPGVQRNTHQEPPQACR